MVPPNRRTEYVYDAKGNVTTVRNMAGTGSQITQTFTYTPEFNLLATATDARSQTTTFTYDAKGRLTQVKDPLNNLTKFEYNAQGLINKVIDPRNQETLFSYALNDLAAVTDPLGRSSVFFTDTLGRVTQTVNPLGHRSLMEYDVYGRIKKVTDPLGNFSSYAYDANGNLTSFTDPRGGVTEYTWDAKNRMTQRKDPLLKTESFGYDLSDNLTSHTDRKSQVTAYTYDELDRRTLTTWHGGATTAYTYDAVDRLTQITDSASGTITRQYDNRFDAVTQEVTPLGAGTTTINYTYDAAGRRTQMQTVGQTAVTYGYDNANRLTGITQGANSVGITYDAASRRTVTTIPNGVSMEYGYDNANQLTAITYKRSGSTIGGLTYTYDNAGRRTSMGGTYARTNLPPGLTTTAYDANNRLTNWNGTTYTYDHNGNLTSDGVRTHTWNVRDQLTAMSGGGITASFTYDAFNRRRDRTINGSHNDFIYDGFQPIHTMNGTAISGTLLSGMRLDERYARITSGGTTALVSDAQDSLLHMIDAAGNTTATLTYEPYGKATHSGSDSTGYRYTGQLEDATGLMYYRNRYYDPRTSRFISEDPIGLEGGYNLYRYVDGNPISRTDPEGLQGDPLGLNWDDSETPAHIGTGNMFPGFTPQDNVCTVPTFVGSYMNANSEIRQCCVVHDACFARYRCNASSWLGNLVGKNEVCQRCNSEAASCIATKKKKPYSPVCEQ